MAVRGDGDKNWSKMSASDLVLAFEAKIEKRLRKPGGADEAKMVARHINEIRLEIFKRLTPEPEPKPEPKEDDDGPSGD